MLTKQAIDVSFAEGLDTKTDPKRVSIGKFLRLVNTVFNKGGLLQKRNGYGALSSLPDSSYSYLTTFNGDLTAIGSSVAAYNPSNASFVTKGSIEPLSLRAQPVLRNNLNQTACDTAVAPNGLMCTVYLESDGSITTNKYVIADATTGQNITAPAAIPVGSGAVSGGMRVFVLGNNFIIVFTNTITAVDHLQYVSISINDPTVIGPNTDIASAYIAFSTLSWDGYVVGNNLYIAYNTTSGGQSVKITYLTRGGVVATPVTYATYKATMMSVTADVSVPSHPVIWVSFYRVDTHDGQTLALDTSLNEVLAPTTMFSSQTALNITSAAQNNEVTIFLEISDSYSYDSGIPTNYIQKVTVNLNTTVVSGTFSLGVGLASKAFIVDSIIYVLAAYQSPYQSSYFLINGSTNTPSSPVIAARLAYENGGGYLTKGLPSVSVDGSAAKIAYLFKDLIQAVNKNTNVPTGSQTAGVYSQTGINLATFTIGTDALNSTEMGANLNISGGFLWMYDGYLPVEQGFLLWPDSVEATWSATGGSMVAKPDTSTNTNAYYYQVTYEWTDNQGNAFRSAPSIPVAVTTTGSGTSGSVTVNIPTLRMTLKTANKVKVVIYRWSVGQQSYYQTTSITSPLLNDVLSNSVQFVDTHADSTILGNNLLYTTGGVVENIAAPGTDLLSIFDTRLWLVDAEDRNLLWFSKQVIESTPVEMSDLFTVYVPPTIAQATGEITAIAPMDDKLIISKGGNSLVYINGTGPDNTGAGNQYSPPTFITSTVGCANQRSIVLIPDGLMFQSNKGIWLLNRELGTSYIGAPVEDLTTGAAVTSAVSVPETNQVRFTLSTGVILMYDYYYGQWGSFEGSSAISSTIYSDLHTVINSNSRVFQETPGEYLDGSSPVLINFKTGPLRLDQLQSYQRAYFFYLLGEFISPHKLLLSLSYDYEQNPSQSILITPDNYSTPYGSGLSQSPYGAGTPYGGASPIELWRVFLERQRCMAFSISLQEIFDSSYGVPAGAGLTISGLNVICGFKKPFRPQPAAQSAG